MKLKTLTARGLKARSFIHELTAVNLFIGKNRVGKTARAEAIKILLTGCDPDRGEKNTKTIFGGRDVTIAGTFDNQEDAFQSWKANGKGGWTRSKDCALPFETPPVLLNVNEYLKMSASDRLNYVLKKANIELDLDDATATAKNTKLEENSAETEALLNELVDDIRTLAEETEEKKTGAMGFLEAVVDKLAEKVSDANKEVKRLNETIAGNVQQSERRQEEPVRPDIEEIVKAARADLAKLQTTRKQDIQKQFDYNARKKLRDGLEAEIAKLGNPEPEIARLEEEAKPLRLKISQLELDLQALNKTREEFEKRDKARADYQSKLDKHESNKTAAAEVREQIAKIEALPNPRIDRDGVKRQHDLGLERQRAQIALATANAKIAEIKLKIDNLQPEKCPHCKKEHPGQSSENYALELAGHKSDRADAQKFLNSTAEEFEKLSARLQTENDQRVAYHNASQRLPDLRRELLTLEYAPDVLETAREFLEQVPALPQPPARETIQEQIQSLRSTLRTIDQDLSLAKANLADLTTHKAKLEANPPLDPVDEASITTAEAIEEAEKELEALENDYKRHVANLADQRREEETRRDLETAKVKQALYKAVQEKFTIKRQELTEKAFGPILKIANQFTAGFMPSIQYRDGELGWVDSGNWVEHSGASGIEEVLVGVGLAVALCQEAPFKVVILGKDEMARFDRENKVVLMNKVIAAVGAGLIDQFFGVDTAAEPYKDFAANPEVTVSEIYR